MYSTSSSSSDPELESATRYTVPVLTDELHINEPLPGALFRRRQQRRRQGEEDPEEERPASPRRLNCSCNNCIEWAHMRDCEKRCCNDIPEIRAIMSDARLAAECMIKHPDFELVVANATIHKITLATFDRREKSVLNDLVIHKQHRYVAYCNVSRWIYGRLGKGNRVPLAACVVNRIRQIHSPPLVDNGVYNTSNYPHFVGFQEAPEEEVEVDELENDGMPVLRGDDE